MEIKISLGDLKKDMAKKHSHKHSKLSRLYFAIPEKLFSKAEYIPNNAGIIVVHPNGYCELKKTAVTKPRGYKICESERSHILHLGCMRIWSLKRRIQRMKNHV